MGDFFKFLWPSQNIWTLKVQKMSFTQLWLKSWIINFLHANICASMFINKVHTALIIYNFGSHAFYFLVVAKWFSSIVVVHITAMFNVHIRIGHRWNKGQKVLLPQNSVFVLQSRVCEKMSLEEYKRVVYICRHLPYNLKLSRS